MDENKSKVELRSDKDYWNNIYRTKSIQEVSWYQAKPQLILETIISLNLSKNAPIIDVGSGASTLIDFLLQDKYTDITVLDISAVALDLAKNHLGKKASLVHWEVADIREHNFGNKKFCLWSDRAVFHFFTDAQDQAKYVEILKKSMQVGGIVIMSTFTIGGPKKCSGLDIVQHDANSMQTILGPQFELLTELQEIHMTPSKSEQLFWTGVFCYNR